LPFDYACSYDGAANRHEIEAMSKKNGDSYCIVDHANKLADRECANPNRAQQRLLRTWDKTSGQSTTVEIPDWRESIQPGTTSAEPDTGTAAHGTTSNLSLLIGHSGPANTTS
jgi:hypothetical protein